MALILISIHTDNWLHFQLNLINDKFKARIEDKKMIRHQVAIGECIP